MPDRYRGSHREEDSGATYAGYVRKACDRLAEEGVRPVFLAESAMSCGGQVFFPDGYLTAAYAHVREAGGVCIADEVQVGLGRFGDVFWGFEAQDVVPDIVTIGKPIGNGHPMGAVVTTPELAATFANGMEYFNTFGGNPVSCAVGLVVLDVLESERLVENAKRVGARLLNALESLPARHSIVGDVRGCGLFFGIELVRDRRLLEPADREAAYVVNRLAERGFLLSTDGPLENVIKIKPPLVFTADDADRLFEALDDTLGDDPVRFRQEPPAGP